MSPGNDKYLPGKVFFDFALAIDGDGPKNGYDWAGSKISVNLGIVDISKLIGAFRANKNLSLFHKFKDDTKSICLAVKSGGGFFLSVDSTAAGGKKKISTPIDGDEALVISTLLTFSIPALYGWD